MTIENAARVNYFELFPEELIASILDAFVINQPMNGSAGGDGFWVSESNDFLFIVIFDCMGHGYSASMMTRIYTKALEKTINTLAVHDPGQILTSVHEEIKTQFEGKKTHVGTGADMGVLRVSKMQKEIAYAGARIDLLQVQSGSLEVVKPDRMQLGEYFDHEHNYNTKKLTLNEGEVASFYLASDGFKDLFGGPENKKLGKENIRNLLEGAHDLPMISQKDQFQSFLANWSGSTEPLDDLLLIGVRI